jgi:hypothetical protein
MNELDDKIRQALEETGIDAGEFENEDEDTLRMLIADAYSGKLRWMSILAAFCDAGSTDDRILWATVFLMAGTMVSMLKLMQWMMINRNRILREVKRLELEIARMGKKLST